MVTTNPGLGLGDSDSHKVVVTEGLEMGCKWVDHVSSLGGPKMDLAIRQCRTRTSRQRRGTMVVPPPIAREIGGQTGHDCEPLPGRLKDRQFQPNNGDNWERPRLVHPSTTGGTGGRHASSAEATGTARLHTNCADFTWYHVKHRSCNALAL